MKLNRVNGIYVLESTYAERQVPKVARFRWHGGNCWGKCPACAADIPLKVWWTNDLDKAAQLAEHADPAVRADLLAHKANLDAATTGSRATDAEIDVPAPAGLSYMPFQRAGIAYAMSRPATLFGDEMGLGKTIEALGVINSDPSIRKILIVVPASLKINWKREAEKWLVRDYSIAIVNGKDAPRLPDADILIINYDIIKRFRAVHETHFDLLIVDEVHYLKNRNAQRTKFVFGYWDKKARVEVPGIQASRKLYLTGTPIVNRPAELFGILHSLDGQRWRSWNYYAKRFCNAHYNGYGYDYSGAKNLDELQGLLRQTIMVRRLKKDVLKELPAKIRQIIELPDNGAHTAVKAEEKAWAKHEELLEDLRAAVELAKASDDPADYKQAVAALREGLQVAFTEISAQRHATAVAKVPYVVKHLEDVLESGKKAVVFAHHHDVVDALADAFGDKAVVLTGRTSQAKRQVAVDRFQNDENVQLFIGSIKAAGVGLTLTAASHVVFAELDWVPGNVTQAEDRCHRIGQTESVLIQHLVLEGSLDARMAEILVEKQRVIDEALDVEHPDRINKALAELKDMPTVPSRDGRSGTENYGYDALGVIAGKLTEKQMEAIGHGLQLLASMCDGARDKDNMGFNGCDSKIGKALALRVPLTPRQAAVGYRILPKYHRQIGAELIAVVKGEE